MRVLHTSDWHVGKKIKGLSRLDEQARVLDEIVKTARSEEVDIALVAGDLFENAAPSPEMTGLVYRTLLALHDGGAKVVVIGGNHDNQPGLDALAPLVRAVGITVLGRVTRPDEGGFQEITIRTGERMCLALVPFLSQRYVVRAEALMNSDAAEHNATYDERVRSIISALTAGFRADAVNVIVAHLMVRGGTLGGGERDAQTIFEYSVDSAAFPAHAQYVALGHLHRFQQVGGTLPIYYSGSPLQVDFGESEDEKGIVLVDVAPGTPARATFRPLTSGQRLRTVTGTVAELSALAQSVGDDLLRVFVKEKRRAGLADEVREVLPNAVEVRLHPDFEEKAGPQNGPTRYGRSAHELFVQFLEERNIEDPRLVALFDELHDEARTQA